MSPRNRDFRRKTKAERDPLTNLYNRYVLEEFFESLVMEEKGGKYALLYIDLNDFKIMNDTYGHDFGDFILKSVGEDLNHVVREGDMVARIGGDELVVLFSLGADSRIIHPLAERISHAIIKPRTFKDVTISVKASMGVSVYPDHGEDMDVLLKKADQTMYEIKKQKKHGVAYV